MKRNALPSFGGLFIDLTDVTAFHHPNKSKKHLAHKMNLCLFWALVCASVFVVFLKASIDFETFKPCAIMDSGGLSFFWVDGVNSLHIRLKIRHTISIP